MRDAALYLVRAKGKLGPFWQDADWPVLQHIDGGWMIAYRGPELGGKTPTAEWRFNLNIWQCDAPWRGKVLNIAWQEDGTVRLISFRRGDWEAQLLAMGAEDLCPVLVGGRVIGFEKIDLVQRRLFWYDHDPAGDRNTGRNVENEAALGR